MDNQQLSINSKIYYQVPKKGYGFVYKYTSPSGKAYIGQTAGSLKIRARNLVSGAGYKKCSLFWKAINKYGFLNFKVEILEEVPLEKIDEREIFFIEKNKTIAPYGYNLSFGGKGGKSKEVFVYSAQSGEFIERYPSLTEASLFTEVPLETICAVIKQQNRKQAHNLIFLDRYIEKYDISFLLRKNYTKIFVYDKNGNYLSSYDKITDAAKHLGISDVSIRKVLNGASSHASYFQFCKEKVDQMPPILKNSKSPISVVQIDPDTGIELRSFESLSEATKAVGLKSGDGIKKVITRGKGTSGGYFWRINESSTTK